MTIKDLEPKVVWNNFYQITRIPRPSKHEEKIRKYLLDWGKSKGFETFADKTGNVIIRVPATPGFEDRKGVILQGHMDMVPQKNADTVHDFEKDPIETWVDGEWLRAKGTTLGADNGLGVAMGLSVLEDPSVKHGPVEVLVTYDEETGMTGARALEPGVLKGDILINLDSEDEGQIFVSCAGGCRTEAVFTFTPEPTPEGLFFLRLQVKGLMGGHSGDDIDKKRANANKILARFLYTSLKRYGLRLSDIQAGGLHNAIPREAEALVAVPVKYKEQIRIDWNLFAADVEEEFRVTEPSMQFLLESADAADTVLPADVNYRLISALQAVHNGILAMSQDMELVETSSNLASIRQEAPGRIRINSSQRSSFMSNRHNMANTIAATFELAGAEVNIGEGYPGWKPNPDSRLLKVTVEQYERLFGRKPIVRGIHAGLECGLFSEKYPNLDMVSFGPTLRGVHSPDERLEIKTVDLVWKHLLAILENI